MIPGLWSFTNRRFNKERVSTYVILFLLIVVFAETAYIMTRLNLPPEVNDDLEYLLALREIAPPESSRMVFDDLEQIGCTISKLEDRSGSSDIELDDYSAFLILAQGYEVKMSQDFIFDWNPLLLTWVDSIHLISETRHGTIGWQTSFTYYEFIKGVNYREVFDKKVARRKEIFEEHGLFDAVFRLDESEASFLGRRFLNSLGYETGKGTYIKLETRTPNTFWRARAPNFEPDIIWLLFMRKMDHEPNLDIKLPSDTYRPRSPTSLKIIDDKITVPFNFILPKFNVSGLTTNEFIANFSPQ